VPCDRQKPESIVTVFGSINPSDADPLSHCCKFTKLGIPWIEIIKDRSLNSANLETDTREDSGLKDTPVPSESPT